MTPKIAPGEKERILEWCDSLRITPSALVRAHTTQISYELKILLNN